MGLLKVETCNSKISQQASSRSAFNRVHIAHWINGWMANRHSESLKRGSGKSQSLHTVRAIGLQISKNMFLSLFNIY